MVGRQTGGREGGRETPPSQQLHRVVIRVQHNCVSVSVSESVSVSVSVSVSGPLSRHGSSIRHSSPGTQLP